MILSRDNSRVKWMRSLLDGKGRKQEGSFLIEGAIQADEALSAGLLPRLILYDSAALQASRRGRQLLERMDSLHGEGSQRARPAVCL